MLVDVTAAGFACPWEFPGAAGFDVWAQQRLWTTRGGLCVLRTADPSFSEVLEPALSRALRGHHGDFGRLDILRAKCGKDMTPFAALLDSFGADPTLPAFQARELLVDHVRDRCAVVVLSEGSDVSARVWEQFVAAMEFLCKGGESLRLCVVVLDHRGVVLAEPSFDFRYGRPTHLILSQPQDADETALWSAYLHHRATWETSGQASLAQTLGEELCVAPHGNDESVEQALNDFAARLAQKVSDLGAVTTDLSLAMGHRSSGHIGLRSTLQQQGLLWRPSGQQRLEVAPWLARQILRAGRPPDNLVWRLRSTLVCAPLASEILSLCLGMESTIRMQQHGRLRSADPETRRIFNRFRAGESDFVTYPSGYPLPPTREADIWAFASLGALLMSCTSPPPQPCFDTMHLRNAIAHGHYVTWQHVRRAWEQRRLFDV